MAHLDGIDLWKALVSGGESPRVEMLLSMRDADLCGGGATDCTHRGELAYRKGDYKLISGHTSLRGAGGDECDWTGTNVSSMKISCWNGWSQPHDVGPLRAPAPTQGTRPGQPANTSIYTWGGLFLFDIANDPTEEYDLSASLPALVHEMVLSLEAYNRTQISQSVMKQAGAGSEPCGPGNTLSCSVPWLYVHKQSAVCF